MITTLSDVNNSFLSRREITCDFKGLGGKLKKLEAIEMITKEFKLDGKLVIPIKLQNHTGIAKITGIFYVYDDEILAKKHINPVIFTRLDKAKTPKEKKEEVKADDKEKKEEVKADDKPAVTEGSNNKSNTEEKTNGESS